MQIHPQRSACRALTLLAALLLFSIPTAAQPWGRGVTPPEVGRCQAPNGAIYQFFADGLMQSAGGIAWAQLDRTGQAFLELPSALPTIRTFFVQWPDRATGRTQVIGVAQGGQLVQAGYCQFDMRYVPDRAWPGWGVPVPVSAPNQGSPYGAPLITSQAKAEACYQGSASGGTVDEDRFRTCMIEAMTSPREASVVRCARESSDPTARSLCMVGALGGQRERQIAGAVQECYADNSRDWSGVAACAGGKVTGGDAQRVLQCIDRQVRQSGNADFWGTAACYGMQQLDLNPETQIIAQCAVTSDGEPRVFVACAGGQLSLREMDKCLSGGVGGPDGCFGPNNEIIRALRAIGMDLRLSLGPNNFLLQDWDRTVGDLATNVNRETARALQNVSNEIDRAANRVTSNVERETARAIANTEHEIRKVVPRVRVRW